jgi:predicted acylesterase/phospholipase RssA
LGNPEKREEDAMDIDQASLDELITRANQIRKGSDEDPQIAFKIAKRLANAQYLEYARRLADHIQHDQRLQPARAMEVRQKLALWTSKNPDLPDDSKHDDALKILDSIKHVEGGESLVNSTDSETLGIAGGICKRRWLIDGQTQTLERSLRFYERGVARGIEKDRGYTAINAAFVNDLLASLDDPAPPLPTERARRLRQNIVEILLALENEPAYPGGPPLGEERWFHETIAEAYFGLREYEQAKRRLERIDWEKVAPWEFETTARQFAWLARLLDPDAKTSEDFQKSDAWSVLRRFFGDSSMAGAGSLFAGKLGLALSGGGFRASLFHIGVLAGLAELDMLRHVEVLSCVSGGSIVGAYYYLEIRKLLMDHEDGKITHAQYIDVVERIADHFLIGIKKNIRTRVASNIKENLKMMFWPGYTRTNRLGTLYEKHLYSQVPDAEENGRQERILRNLIVRPKGNESCKPKYDNWRRRDKVPILILNATTINTGHNWQFTATWMGEPPSQIESDVDGNFRLRRMYFENEVPATLRDIHIGQAVAASSCVPGLFTPLELRNLYKDITVRLVDGGVHDNQGVFGLLDQNCTVLIVSDASGQMAAEDNPKDGIFSVLSRSSSIAMARVRTAEYRELFSRKQSGRLKGLLFLHLKKDLKVLDKDWIDCDNPKELSEQELRKIYNELTDYNIMKAVQRKIADIRTDLDSFSTVEAFALMASGLKMMRTGFCREIQGFQTYSNHHSWKFLDIDPYLVSSRESEAGRIAQLLDVAKNRAFKIWHISIYLKTLTVLMGLAMVGGLGWVVSQWGGEPFLTIKGLVAAAAVTVLSILLGAVGLKAVVQLIRYRKTVHQILVAAGLCVFGTMAAWIHLIIFDRWFLNSGRLGKK